MSAELQVLIKKLNKVCKIAVQKAAENCVSNTHYNVEIEHLVYELIKQENTDIKILLEYYDIKADELENQLIEVINGFKRGNNRTPSMSPEIVELFQEAWVFASVSLCEKQISSGSVIVGLFASRSLRSVIRDSAPSLLSLSYDGLRKNVVELIKKSPERVSENTSYSGNSEDNLNQNRDESYLSRFTNDITAKAKSGELDPIEGRDDEIRQIIDILTRRRQNNPILTGDAGVGKTAIVEGLASKIVAGAVPPSLQNVSLRALDIGLLQAGAGVKGEFEERLKTVISEVKSSPVPIILFIDEAHTLIGAGGQAGQNDAANLIKPALARGELRTIAATTWSEYKKYFEKDHALVRRFQVINVAEPTVEAAIEMLRYVAGPLEKHHNVRILNGAIEAAVKLSHKYINGRKLPDKAISLLDTACARVAVSHSSEPAIIEDQKNQIRKYEDQLKQLERENLISKKFDSKIEDLIQKIKTLKTPLKEIKDRWSEEQEIVKQYIESRTRIESDNEENREQYSEELIKIQTQLKELQKEEPLIHPDVNQDVVATIVSNWTGVPLGKMVVNELDTILDIKNVMAQRLKGQDHALEMIAKRIKTSKAQLDDPEKPAGVFLLVGPSGVGKTETALTLAEIMYGGEDKVISVNMSEYQEAHTVSLLKGSPPGYVGFGTGGVLTEAVRRQPFSVVLLDEVEKAHPDVMELFFQVFDKGVIEDGEGVRVSFKDTIILLTSNIGTDVISDACQGADVLSFDQLTSLVKPELLKHFKPAFLGRLVTIPFLQLSDDQIEAIVHLKLEKISKRFFEHNNATLSFDPELIKTIATRCTEVDTGARNIDHILTNSMLPELSEEILIKMADRQKINSVHISINESGFFEYQFQSESDFN